MFGHFYYTITERRYFILQQKICRIYAALGVSQTPMFITEQIGEDNDRDLVKIVLPEAKKPFPHMNLA